MAATSSSATAGSPFMEDGYGYMSFDYANKYANDLVEYVLP